jgi:patatin-like phospholipase/acyl hydrolase
LATCERAAGLRAVEHFDLIAGTSTGCIIALGLAMGAQADEIARFYELGP